MKKLALIGWVFAFGFSGAVWLIYAVVAGGAKDVWVINEFDKDTQELNIELDKPDKSDPDYALKFIKCLGQPMLDEPQKIVCSDSDLSRHEAAPDIAYLGVDKEKGENPLQLKTVFFLSKWASGVSAACGAVVLLIWLVLAKISKSKPSPAPPAA